MWKILGVNDQTSAVVTLKALTAERDQAWKMVAEADTRLGQALGEAIQDKADNARLREALTGIKKAAAHRMQNDRRDLHSYYFHTAAAALNTGKEPSHE
jgi:predicted transcriptional regulator